MPKQTEGNLRRLRVYTEALLQPLREHTEDDEARFSSAELVLVLLSAAQIVQMLDVMGIEKSPYEIEGIL